MKTVVTDICNTLMSISISNTLQQTGEFSVHSIRNGSGGLIERCMALGADIALLEVSHDPGFTIEDRIGEVQMLRRSAPSCRVLILCDENSTPELARKVAQAKRDGVISEFIYSSVSESYLAAVMDTI